MSNINRSNKPARKDRLRLIASGAQTHFPSGQKTLAGQTLNLPTDLVNLIQTDISNTDAADKARADWLAAVQVQTDSHDKLTPILRAFERMVLAQFGDTQDAASTLADFGFAPQKVSVPTVETKAAAVEKSRATRAARHTMGPKQKSAIKGNVTGVLVSPITGPTPVVTPVTTASPTSPATSTGTAFAATPRIA
jgi:hypothetical protein